MNVLAGKSFPQRLWLIGGGLGAFLIVLIGYAALVAPQRSTTADVRAQVDAARTTNLSVQSRIDSLRAQSKNLSTYTAQARAADAALPATSGIPDFLRTLQSLGTSTHTNAVSLTVGSPVDVTSVATGVTTTPAAASTATTPTTPSAAAPAAGSVYGLTISAQVNGSASALNQFLDQLQRVQPRAVLVTQITEGTAVAGSSAGATATGAATGTGTTLQLTMQAFVAPTSPAESAQLAATAAH